MPTLRPLADCRLYTFVDTAYLHGRAPETVAQALCDGGADLVQLRAKGAPAKEVQSLAERLAPIVARAGVWFVVNDHLEVARAVGAPLCHLGQEDFFGVGHHHVKELATAAGPDPLIGLSSHAPGQAELAVAAGAAYVAVGPVFATPTKPGRPPVTVEYVRWAVENLQVPWFAIGGIHRGNLPEILAAGAQRICVVSAILDATDIAGACREFKQRLPSASA